MKKLLMNKSTNNNIQICLIHFRCFVEASILGRRGIKQRPAAGIPNKGPTYNTAMDLS